MSDGTPRHDTSSVVSAVDDLCELARRLTAGTELAAEADRISARFRGPMRIAIAGRVKAGKSTLLNALVGERLAATDAGECTRIVTTYRHASGYEVAAELHDGSVRPLRFSRRDGALAIELDGLSHDDIARLDVGWPARVLAEMTLIDTPGLSSLNDEHSQRTRAFLDHTGNNPAGADAVIYLMRHLHRTDAEFLGSFMDRTVAGASPVNALAVLSRADEIGACRPDAMASAERIAARYASDPTVRTLVSRVLPVAGLLAETGLTLSEAEFADIARLAGMTASERAVLTLSVDDFCDVAISPLTAETRRSLLDRFGLFGARRAIDAVASGEVGSSGELARRLVADSGVAALTDVMRSQFLPRARLLQARSALVSLRGLAAAIDRPDDAAALAGQLDRTDAGAIEFAVLQAAHLVMSGAVTLDDRSAREVTALLSTSDFDAALGLSEGGVDERRSVVLEGLGRWRDRGADPLANSLSLAVADTMARLFERAYSRLER
jgi:hypothetical protein